MSRKNSHPKVSRRKFLAGVAVAGAASALSPQDVANAATTPTSPSGAAPASRPSAVRPSAAVAAAETGVPKDLPHAQGPAGCDFMVDVIKTLDI